MNGRNAHYSAPIQAIVSLYLYIHRTKLPQAQRDDGVVNKPSTAHPSDGSKVLMEQATHEPEQSPRRIVAESAKALCVYADMGGALGISPAIEVVRHAFEDEKVSAPDESMPRRRLGSGNNTWLRSVVVRSVRIGPKWTF